MAAALATDFLFGLLALAAFASWAFFTTFFIIVFMAAKPLGFFAARFIVFFALDFFFALRAIRQSIVCHGLRVVRSAGVAAVECFARHLQTIQPEAFVTILAIAFLIWGNGGYK